MPPRDGTPEPAPDILAEVTAATVAAASGRVDELAGRRLDDRAYIVMYLDGARIGSHEVLVALGVDPEGRKRLLGARAGGESPDDRGLAASGLLADLVSRGLRTDRRRLFVTEGSPELRDAIGGVFGPDFLVQRCRSHVLRTVLRRFAAGNVRWVGRRRGDAARARGSLRDALRKSFDQGAERGPRALAAIADQLEADGRSAAAGAVGDSLADLFTVDKLELHPKLRKSLSTTHSIYHARSGLPRQICAPADWNDPAVAVTWTVASFLESESTFQRIAGCHHLQILRDHLAQLALPGTLGPG